MYSMFNRDVDLFDLFFNSVTPWAGSRSWKQDPVQVTSGRDNDNYIIRAITPGFDESELNIQINGREVVVSGKREQADKSDNYHVSSHSSFQESVIIPEDGLLDKVEAEYKNGILAVTIPRRPISRLGTKTIPIKALGPAEKDSQE